VNEIVAAGELCFQGSCSEVYLEKAFDNTPCRLEKRLANAFELGATSLMFLVHPTLTQAETAKAVQVMKEVFELAKK
jgi:dTDP-4-amino-4,6-dideoxygalactose transaminase